MKILRFFNQYRKLTTKSGENFSKIVKLLQSTLSDDKVKLTTSLLEQHSHDESYHRKGNPDVVVFPNTEEEIVGILRICNEHHTPVIPFGTGTGLEGGVVPLNGGVCINLIGLNRIISVNQDDFDCTVEPGVTRKSLNENLRHVGLWFPIDPGADCSLCGMCATSASGTNAVRYGTMRENVLNLRVILSDGRIVDSRGSGRRTKKSAAGYNLTNLFIGSEGTLGVITRATLKLYGVPETVAAAVIHFDTEQNAVDSVVQILQSCIPVARIEFLDDVQMDACNKYSKLNYPVTPTLFIEFHGTNQEVKAQATLVGEVCAGNRGSGFQWTSDRKEREILWRARHDAYYSALALRPGCRGYITDVCVPLSQLTFVIVETKKDIVGSNLICPMVGHVGDGNFHVTMLVDSTNRDELASARLLSDRIVQRALDVGGTCTGEHGVGLGKKRYLLSELGQNTMDLMRSIKRTIDPNNIMNPGKVLPE